MTGPATIRLSRGDQVFDIVNYSLLSIILVVVLYPLLFVVSASISDPNQILLGNMWLIPKGFTLDGYRRIFENERIWLGYRNSIIYTLAGTTLNVTLTIAGAYPLSRRDFAGRAFFMGLIVFTMFFTGGLIPLYLVVRRLGMLNTRWAMIIPNAVAVWNLIITRTYFQSTIPDELLDSAQMDGCTNIRFLMSIVLPLSLPIVAVMGLFYGVQHWNTFFNALIYLSDAELFPLQIVLREILIQNQMLEMSIDVFDPDAELRDQLIAESIKYGVIIVASVPVLLAYPFIQRYFVKGVMVGSLKG